MPQVVNLNIKGLYTAPNDFTGVPNGALDVADDIVIDQDNLATPRRGFTLVAGTLPNSNDRINTITSYQSHQVAQAGSTSLVYYASGAWQVYSGSYAPPDATLAAVRFFEGNQNLYISTSNGVYKLDAYNSTPKLAGVPQGLDMQLSLTGSSGFMSTNVVVSTTASTTNASPTLSLVGSTAGIVAGQYISGTGITAGTTVSSVATSATVLITTGNTTAGNTALTTLAVTTGIVANQLVTGTGILAGTRVVSIVATTVTLSQSATTTATGTTVTFSSDPTVTMSANATATNTGTALTFSSGSQVGYRGIWGIVDANNNVVYGAPTQFATVTNNTGTTSNVQAITSIPSGITTAHFFQLYRSATTATASVTPLDDEQLVYSTNPSSGDISAGFITITDITPDSLKGAYLYTGISQQGIAQANYPPPFCKDFCSFRNYGIYANTKSNQQLLLTMLAIGGVTATDTLTIAGTTYTADTVENTATGHFQVFTTGTPAQNVANTVNSLIKVINRYATNTTVYAYLLSGPTDLPGQMLIQARVASVAQFYAVASAHGSSYSPTLPTSGTTVASNQNVNKNALFVAKQGIYEGVPQVNVFYAGSAAQEILRVIPLRDYVVILKQDGIWRLSGLTLQNFVVSPFDGTTKLLAPNSAVSLSNEVWGFFDQGVCSVSDTGVNVRSRPIEDVLNRLIGTALNAVKTVSFGVGYETDRKYILALPSTSGDATSTQQYIFHTFTNAWTRWTRNASGGFIDPVTNSLYLGNGTANTVSAENKTYTYADFCDEGSAVTIASSSTYYVTMTSAATMRVGDVLYQSATVFSVVTAIDYVTNIVTVQDLLTWANGAATVLPYITNTIQWKPIVAGNPVYVRHYPEGGVLFKKASFPTATISFATDVDQNFEATTIYGSNLGTWGSGLWGSGYWGGLNPRPLGIRFLVPQPKQMCSQLTPKLIIKTAFVDWQCEGVAVSYEDVGQEIG